MEHPMNNKQPESAWYSIIAQADATADVMIYDEIGGNGVAADKFIKDLKAIKASTINVHINSPGGSVFAGNAIANAFKNHKAHIVTHVDGIAASIASVIAISGDEVQMADNAFLMIHNPMVDRFTGDAADLRKQADVLDKMTAQVQQSYVNKSGKPVEEVSKWMNAETWFTAKDALEAGLIDSISKPVELVASWNEPSVKIPDTIRAQFLNKSREPAAPAQRIEVKNMAIDIDSFKNFAAEHPEAVEEFINKGKEIAKADLTPKPAKVADLKAAFEGHNDFIMDILDESPSMEQAKAKFADHALGQFKALKAEIADLKNKLEVATEGQGPIKVGAAPVVATIDPSDFKAVAANEWDSNAKVRDGFEKKENYVNYRVSELSGSLKVINR
jgi:ATP-dependent Clp endopeptidase proteolytic subunit ClpP